MKNYANLTIGISLVAMVICLSLAGFNASQVSQAVEATGAPPSTWQISFVALPSLGALGSLLTAIGAFVAKWWQSPGGGTTADGASLMANLRAIATIANWLGSKPFAGLVAAIQQYGWPSYGKIELGWRGRTPFKTEWAAPEEQLSSKGSTTP